MLSYLRAWRERGWQPIAADDYAALWRQHGGSVATHPDVIARLAALADLPVRYLGCEQAGRLTAALPTWGRHLALSKIVLKRHKKRDLFDLGNAEIIVPIAPDARIPLRHRLAWVSERNAVNSANLRPQKDAIMLARAPENTSAKFRYNQRRELRLVQDAGGVFTPVAAHSAADIAAIYTDLFTRRFGFAPKGWRHLEAVFGLLHEFMAGQVLYLNTAPVAVQILYRVAAPGWVSLEYINGGVDPRHHALSPGSVLTYLNTQAAWAHARALGVPLRYSFGRADNAYKERWCARHAVYCT